MTSELHSFARGILVVDHCAAISGQYGPVLLLSMLFLQRLQVNSEKLCLVRACVRACVSVPLEGIFFLHHKGLVMYYCDY